MRSSTVPHIEITLLPIAIICILKYRFFKFRIPKTTSKLLMFCSVIFKDENF